MGMDLLQGRGFRGQGRRPPATRFPGRLPPTDVASPPASSWLSLTETPGWQSANHRTPSGEQSLTPTKVRAQLSHPLATAFPSNSSVSPPTPLGTAHPMPPETGMGLMLSPD